MADRFDKFTERARRDIVQHAGLKHVDARVHGVPEHLGARWLDRGSGFRSASI